MWRPFLEVTNETEIEVTSVMVSILITSIIQKAQKEIILIDSEEDAGIPRQVYNFGREDGVSYRGFH